MDRSKQGVRVDSDLLTELDRGIAALTALDAGELESIVRRLAGPGEDSLLRSVAEELAQGLRRQPAGVTTLQERHQVLGTLVRNTENNLAVLQRLHDRRLAGGSTWVL